MTKTSQYIITRILPVVIPLAGMYLIWFAVSFIVFNLETLFGVSGTILEVISQMTVAGFILTASFLSLLFIVYVDEFLEDNLFLRMVLLFSTLLIGIGLYLLVRYTGIKSNVLFCISTANLIVFACVIATWMTGPVQRPSELVPLCSVVAFADIFSVFAGPTKHLAESVQTYYETGMAGTPPLVDFFLIKISMPGYGIMMPVFGVSDWIIVVFLSSALVKFGFNDNLIGSGAFRLKRKKRVSVFYIPVAAAGLIASISAARLTERFIPALPFVIAVFLFYLLIRFPESRKLSKKEWRLLIGFSSIMILLLIVGKTMG